MPRARNPENTGVIFVPGQLSYLPKRRYSDLFSPTDSEIPDGCYNHPVLILSTDQRKKEAVVLILTSLGGKTLSETSWTPRIRALYLPIHPSPPHPDNGILLFLDQGLKLPKKTYVKTEKPISIQWKLLQADYGEYRTGRRYKLKPDSFAKLLLYIRKIGGDVAGAAAAVQGSKPEEVPESPSPSPRRPLSADLQAMFDRLESVPAAAAAGGGNISVSPSSSSSSSSSRSPTTKTTNYSTLPPPQPHPPTLPPKYSLLQAPLTPTTTPQSIARSREGVAAETDRYISQWRRGSIGGGGGGGQLRRDVAAPLSPPLPPPPSRHDEARRPILPTYRVPSAPSSTPLRNNNNDNNAVMRSHDPVAILRRMFVVFLVLAVVFLLIAWWRCQLTVCKRLRRN